MLAIDPIVFADILFKTPYCQRLLFLGEPGRSPGEIREDKVSRERNHDRYNPLNDEKPRRDSLGRNPANRASEGRFLPLPSTVAPNPIHVTSNTC